MPDHPALQFLKQPRVLTALAGAVVAGIVVQMGGVLLLGVCTALAIISMLELQTASRQHGMSIVAPVAFPAVVLLLVGPAFTPSPVTRAGPATFVPALVPGFLYHLSVLAAIAWASVVCLMVAAVLSYPLARRLTLASIAVSVLAIMYVGLFAFFPLLRALPDGRNMVWVVLLTVWAADIAAYYAGKAFGRLPFTSLSPHKTREGALAGVAAAMVACALIALISGIAFRHGAVLGLLIALAATLGDLAESFWKRELGVKDLGSILPGHGGVLDRCDSLLFAVPVTYFYTLWQIR